MSMRLSLLGASLALAGIAPCAVAQDTASARAPDSVPTYGQIISVSPLFAVLGFYTGDIERRLTSNATIGIGGSAFTLGPFAYRSADLRARFYPQERALEGMGVGLSAGYIRLSADGGGLLTSESSSGSGLVVGTDVTYTWLTGKRRNLALSLGGGLKRVLRFGGQDLSGAHLTYPTVRANIGIAF